MTMDTAARRDESSTRAAVYQLLATAFLEPPSEERLEQLRAPEVLAELGELLGSGTLEPLRSAPPDDIREVRQEFNDLFKVPLGKYVPPYEAVHRDSRDIEGVPTRGLLMGPSTVDVRRLYEAAGAELGLSELSDHIGVELAFLAFLCDREKAAYADGNVEAAENYRAYQRGFLQEHLLEWIPAYCETVRQRSSTSYFRVLAAMTPELCRRDLAELEVAS